MDLQYAKIILHILVISSWIVGTVVALVCLFFVTGTGYLFWIGIVILGYMCALCAMYPTAMCGSSKGGRGAMISYFVLACPFALGCLVIGTIMVYQGQLEKETWKRALTTDNAHEWSMIAKLTKEECCECKYSSRASSCLLIIVFWRGTAVLPFQALDCCDIGFDTYKKASLGCGIVTLLVSFAMVATIRTEVDSAEEHAQPVWKRIPVQPEPIGGGGGSIGRVPISEDPIAGRPIRQG